eukprot:Lankesteria_metandrocarpae@DN5093_c0_g1_i4.p1
MHKAVQDVHKRIDVLLTSGYTQHKIPGLLHKHHSTPRRDAPPLNRSPSYLQHQPSSAVLSRVIEFILYPNAPRLLQIIRHPHVLLQNSIFNNHFWIELVRSGWGSIFATIFRRGLPEELEGAPPTLPGHYGHSGHTDEPVHGSSAMSQQHCADDLPKIDFIFQYILAGTRFLSGHQRTANSTVILQ